MTQHASHQLVGYSRDTEMLEFEHPITLPKEFRVHIVSGNITIPAEPCWQRRNEAGVRFTGIATAGNAAAPPKFERRVA